MRRCVGGVGPRLSLHCIVDTVCSFVSLSVEPSNLNGFVSRGKDLDSYTYSIVRITRASILSSLGACVRPYE